MSITPYILAEVCRQLWAITPEALDGILAALRGDLDPGSRQLFHAANLQAVISQVGEPYRDLGKARVTADGVGVIQIDGPIVPRGNVAFDTSGIVSIDRLVAELRAFEGDADIREVLLLIDSPGGSVTGVSEFAALLQKSTKPTAAYVYGFAASAAYWIASATDRITVADTGLVGSIGTVLTVRRKSEGDPIKIISSQSPNKQPDPETDKGASELQRVVDGLASVFIDTVAKNRGVSAERVTEDFGKGSLMLAPAAIKAGMIDAIATLDNYLSVASPTETGVDVGAATTYQMKTMIVDNFSENAENREQETSTGAGLRKGEKTMPTLNEFLADNPEAKREMDRILADTRAEVTAEHNVRVGHAVKILGMEYPENIKAIALEVIEGERDAAQLDTAVTVYDALKAEEKIKQAQTDSRAIPPTPPQSQGERSTDGIVRTEADVEAAAAELRGN